MSCKESSELYKFSNRIGYLRRDAVGSRDKKRILRLSCFLERLGLSKCP
jgi:hypothetical protein